MEETFGLRKDEYIDITDERESDPKKLHQVIVNAVKDTQSAVILAPLPHMLIMSKVQYDILDPSDEMIKAYKSKDRIYLTELNAMDVVVKDAPKIPEFLTV